MGRFADWLKQGRIEFSIIAHLATKKTGHQFVEGLVRKAHFPPVHARIHHKGAGQLHDDARVGYVFQLQRQE